MILRVYYFKICCSTNIFIFIEKTIYIAYLYRLYIYTYYYDLKYIHPKSLVDYNGFLILR